ncbi:hypothetical protein ATANTOWER_022839 [Ataeniobius toweri]|uniref:Uncharacterized protein n=1 Tax=Ataeniobius toweri TaxID=208326 RepID=A0ABU7CLA4_9TELE|nr:hypothetical protein [Ataeniobius toweri]
MEAGVPGENPFMHGENLQTLGVKPRTFLLQGNSTTNCATVQPSRYSNMAKLKINSSKESETEFLMSDVKDLLSVIAKS